MAESASLKQVANALSEVCDAVYDLVVHEEYRDAIDRIERTATTLAAEPRDLAAEISDADGIAAVLRGIKHLSRAMEAVAMDAVERGEMHVDSAVEAFRASVQLLRTAYGEPRAGEGAGAAIQLSVAEAIRVPNEEAVRDALRDLLNRTESDAFVIFVDAHTGNFIQFLGSKEEPLVLDLPVSVLSEDEADRAEKFFNAAGVGDARGEESFTVTLGRDAARATELALGIFARVYESAPDFSLKIEEN